VLDGQLRVLATIRAGEFVHGAPAPRSGADGALRLEQPDPGP
jgi:hypothetical protein